MFYFVDNYIRIKSMTLKAVSHFALLGETCYFSIIHCSFNHKFTVNKHDEINMYMTALLYLTLFRFLPLPPDGAPPSLFPDFAGFWEFGSPPPVLLEGRVVWVTGVGANNVTFTVSLLAS